MKKKIVLIVFVLSLLYIVVGNLSFDKRLNDLMISKDEYDNIVQNKKYNFNLILDKISFDNTESYIDNFQNVYYTLIENNETKYNPKVSYNTNNYVLYFTSSILNYEQSSKKINGYSVRCVSR